MLLKFIHIFVLIITTCIGFEAYAAERPNQIKNQVMQPPASTPVPVTILSIIPAQAEPGSKVTLSGTGFGEAPSLFLGTVEIPARITDMGRAEFILPVNMEAGLYALYLKRADGTVGRTYNFMVLPLRPILSSLEPRQISSCAVGKERELTALGSNFIDTSMLFFDGAALPSRVLSSDSISFVLPPVAGGLHQVQVKNSSENSSVQLTLSVETRPEIGQVTVGNEHVNFYELIISGKNFLQNSSIYVDGVQIGGRGGQDMGEREKLIYIDCTKLIYLRHPYSPVAKDFRLQVVNQSGEGSQVINVTAP